MDFLSAQSEGEKKRGEGIKAEGREKMGGREGGRAGVGGGRGEESLCAQMISGAGAPGSGAASSVGGAASRADDGVAQMGWSLAPRSLLCMLRAL